MPKLVATIRKLTLKLFALEREHSRLVQQGALKLSLKGTRVWKAVGLQSSKHQPVAADRAVQSEDREDCFLCHTIKGEYQGQFGPLMNKFMTRYIDCPLLFSPKKRAQTTGLMLSEVHAFA